MSKESRSEKVQPSSPRKNKHMDTHIDSRTQTYANQLQYNKDKKIQD